MKRIIGIILSLMMILGAVAACQNGNNNATEKETQAEGETAAEQQSESSDATETESENTEKLSIVTTIFPQYDFARQIVGDKADLHMLLKPGAEFHSYEPTPQDIKTIQESDLFIYTGGENDTWVESILESMEGNGPQTMKLVDLVDTYIEEIVEGMEDNHDHDHDHEHGHTIDEHVWTSPVKAKEIVEKMTAKIMELDPANADFYKENSEKYIAELEKLDQKFEDVVENASRKTILFGDRFPFRYLAEEYGLDYYAAFTGCSTDTEVSASTVAFLIDKTNELKLPAVFSIELSNEKIVDSIVESSEAEKLTLHSVHNLSVEEFENGETYISLMEKNVENLAKALQ